MRFIGEILKLHMWASIIITVVIVYIGVLVLMYLFQDKLLFFPVKIMTQTPESVGLTAKDVWVETEDGLDLHGWFFETEDNIISDDDSELVVLFSHGNGGNISHRLEIAALLLEAGVSVLMYDYRGYGKSGGRPSEQGFYKDIKAFINYLITEENIPENKIIMYGRSLGGTIAAYGASQYQTAGLILDSAFINLPSMVRDIYPFVPAGLARYTFPTDKYLQIISHSKEKIPVLIMHSPDDEVIDFEHGRQLYKLAPEPKCLVELKGGHNDSFFISRRIIKKAIQYFAAELR